MKPMPAALERSAVVIFPDAPWCDSAFKPLLIQLANKHPLHWVTNQPKHALQGAPASVTALALHELAQVDWGQTSAMVLHPCWAAAALPLCPRQLGAWMAITNEEDGLTAKWRAALAGEASFVLSLSEPYYLDLSFRRDGVFVLDGADETSDWFALQAVLWAAEGTTPSSLARLQQQRREAAYRERLMASADATLTFYRSVYLYLLGDAAQAERELLAAYELAVLGGEEHALARIYRFRSAIQVAQGNVAAAALTYEASALTDNERAQAGELRRLIENGDAALAAAMLLRLNDDHRQAIERLERLCGTGADAAHGDADTVQHGDRSRALAAKREFAERMLLDSLLQAGRMREAYGRISPEDIASVKDRCEFAMLQGIVLLMDGDRRGAITALLRAAELQHEAIGSLTEILQLDTVVQKLAASGQTSTGGST
ncbi:hypothetical protein [Paenibacillus sp. MMS18-CY102]|uniref:hypothetical protein n=1 Tax=Paenibacillus sp. MMS18-CY102 TaxID=2682849 RepID=UPI0013663402|nr:hypothetical protein [Paenibacillus sp. MMS18-CY102]MWC27347.1 hypothetical protein [Paenibacillus sp. MMS18-CY102]